MIILITAMFTACYFIIAMITAVYKQQQLNHDGKKDRTQQMIQSIESGLLWPFTLISYGAKRINRKIMVGLLILNATVLVVSGCFCDTNTPYQEKKEVRNKQTLPPKVDNSNEQIDGYQTLVVGTDGCDYIYWTAGGMADWSIGGLTHSGSCRKCWAKLDSLIKANK
jgi:energy-converting hydrogenase Eha subunit A